VQAKNNMVAEKGVTDRTHRPLEAHTHAHTHTKHTHRHTHAHTPPVMNSHVDQGSTFEGPAFEMFQGSQELL